MNQLPDLLKKSLKQRGITELRPPQELGLEKGVLDGNNLVLSSPTSSGKTLVAEMAMVNHYLQDGKTLYIVPLTSLASEKYKSFKDRYERFGLKTAISVGSFDKQDPYLNNYDVIITTSEKADSLIRHEAGFLKNVNCVVVDEIHLLDDENRGPTLEVLISTLKQMLPEAQFIGLSATISNDTELSAWLDAELVESDYRPVELKEGVFFNKEFIFEDDSYETNAGNTNEECVTIDTLDRDKQIIFFLSTRRNAEGLPKRLKNLVDSRLSKKEKGKLDIIADKVLNVLEQPTEQCRLLSELVRKGVAFHHAGLMREQKKLVEEAFRKRLIKVVCATPTLAAGVNLPAFRVLVRDLTRFSSSQGRYYLPVLEVKQMFGRAGRPGYEDYGEALTLAKSESEVEDIFNRYIQGEVEEIYSKLGSEPALRTHVLALVSNKFCNSVSAVKMFMKNTFFAEQYSNLEKLNKIVDKLVDSLEDYGFVKEDGEFLEATRLGRRVCELYLDPLVAYNLIKAIINAETSEVNAFNLIQAVCYSGGIRLLRVKDENALEYISLGEERSLLINKPNSFDYEYDKFLKSVKTTLMIQDWISEKPRQVLSDEYRVYPGDLRHYTYTLDWLLYSFIELAKIMNVKSALGKARRLRVRVEYGVKSELFTLVQVKGIGRVRARKLYKNGVTNMSELQTASLQELTDILGPGIGKKVKERV